MRGKCTKLLILLGAAFTVLTYAGCAKVNPKPFDQFSQSTQALRDGADTALKINEEANRERFILTTAEKSLTPDGADAITNLQLGVEQDDPFAWRMEQTPLFMESQKFRVGIYVLNTALVQYSELLKELASPELLSTERFDNMAQNLNSNLASAGKSLKITDNDKEMAIFSVAATEILKSYLESQRKEALIKALKKNQENIENVSQKMTSAIITATTNLNKNYIDTSSRLMVDLANSNEKNLEIKKQRIISFLDVNQQYINRLAVLRSLHDSYATLPRINLEMVKLTEDPKFTSSTIKEIFENGKHLKNLYDEMSESK
jgi:hypothetical protein